MYYIDKEVTLAKSSHELTKKSFHFITRFSVDYVNNSVEAELSSYTTEQTWLDGEIGFVSFISIKGTPRFRVDPVIFVLRYLITNPDSVFHLTEINCNYKLECYPAEVEPQSNS